MGLEYQVEIQKTRIDKSVFKATASVKLAKVFVDLDEKEESKRTKVRR